MTIRPSFETNSNKWNTAPSHGLSQVCIICLVRRWQSTQSFWSETNCTFLLEYYYFSGLNAPVLRLHIHIRLSDCARENDFVIGITISNQWPLPLIYARVSFSGRDCVYCRRNACENRNYNIMFIARTRIQKMFVIRLSIKKKLCYLILWSNSSTTRIHSNDILLTTPTGTCSN